MNQDWNKAFLNKIKEIEANHSINVRNLEQNKSELNGDMKNAQNSNENKMAYLKEKANELISLKNMFKSLLNQTDSSVLKKADMLEEGLDELDQVLKQK